MEVEFRQVLGGIFTLFSGSLLQHFYQPPLCLCGTKTRDKGHSFLFLLVSSLNLKKNLIKSQSYDLGEGFQQECALKCLSLTQFLHLSDGYLESISAAFSIMKLTCSAWITIAIIELLPHNFTPL